MSSGSHPVSVNTPGPKRARTRQRLIETAREAIGEKGFRRTTLDEIAARAGLTKGAIYDNFKTKDELFLAVILAVSGERLDRFPWPCDRRGSLKLRLRRLAQAVIEDAAAWKHEAPLRAELLLYTLTHEELRAGIESASAKRIEVVRERLRRSIADEELPIAAEKFVILLEALIPGLMFIRAQAPHMVTDETIIEIFESLAGSVAAPISTRQKPTAPNVSR